MSDRPVGINRLEVNGAKNTSEWLLETHFRPLLDSQAPDMTSFVEALHARLHHLSQLGIFKSMDVLLDAPSDLSATGDVVPVDVIVRVEERPRFFLKTGTEFSKNEASLVCQSSFRVSVIFSVGCNRRRQERVWKCGDFSADLWTRYTYQCCY